MMRGLFRQVPLLITVFWLAALQSDIAKVPWQRLLVSRCTVPRLADRAARPLQTGVVAIGGDRANASALIKY